MSERLVFIDTETTGISARHGHRIVELAAVEVICGKATGRVLHSLFDPERPVDLGAERVHGLCSSALRGKPKFRDFAGNLLEFVRGSECIMHNAAFDTAFIDSELERAGYHERLATVAKIICSMRLAKARYPGESVTLDALVRRAGISVERGLHSALEDASLLAEAYFQIFHERVEPSTVSASPMGGKRKKMDTTKTISVTTTADSCITAMLGMEKTIELTSASKETFYYRQKHKRIIVHRVVDEKRWKRISGPLLYAVTDASGTVRYFGKWEGATALYGRWLRHDTIHHQERARNFYISDLDAGLGPIAVWSVSVQEIKEKLPAHVKALPDKDIAAGLEALWILRWKHQLSWNSRSEPVPTGFSDGEYWNELP